MKTKYDGNFYCGSELIVRENLSDLYDESDYEFRQELWSVWGRGYEFPGFTDNYGNLVGIIRSYRSNYFQLFYGVVASDNTDNYSLGYQYACGYYD